MADSIKIEVEGQVLLVGGGRFGEMVAAVKSIQGRRFDSARKVWVLTVSLEGAREALEAEGLEVQYVEDTQRSSIEVANAAQVFVRANADVIKKMVEGLQSEYERYVFKSPSSVKAQLGTRIQMLRHALRYAALDLTELDSQAKATLIKAASVAKGDIANPAYAQRGRERPR